MWRRRAQPFARQGHEENSIWAEKKCFAAHVERQLENDGRSQHRSPTWRRAQQLSCRDRVPPKGLEIMFDPVVIGFPRSTVAHIARLTLTHKDVRTPSGTSSRRCARLRTWPCIPSIVSRCFSTRTSRSTKRARSPSKYPAFREWWARMEAWPTVQRFQAAQPPRGPIEHEREWAVSHRPKY